MKAERKTMLVGCGVVLVVLALFLSFCSGGSDPAVSDAPDKTTTAAAAPKAATPAEIERAENDARKAFDIIPLPEGVDAPPITGSCSDTMCATSQVQFAEADWPAAWQGDYDAQRNVAFCLITGCDGAVLIDKSTGCAWRSVILELNSDSARDLDAASIEAECGDLSPVQLDLATRKAKAIAAKVKSLSS